MFLASLHFPYKICTSLSHRPSTLTQVIHLVGQFIMDRTHGVNLTVSDPAVPRFTTGVIVTRQTIKFHHETYLTPSFECVLQDIQCKTCGDVTQYNEITL